MVYAITGVLMYSKLFLNSLPIDFTQSPLQSAEIAALLHSKGLFPLLLNSHGDFNTNLTRSRPCFKIHTLDFRYKYIFHNKSYLVIINILMLEDTAVKKLYSTQPKFGGFAQKKLHACAQNKSEKQQKPVNEVMVILTYLYFRSIVQGVENMIIETSKTFQIWMIMSSRLYDLYRKSERNCSYLSWTLKDGDIWFQI